MPRNKVSNNEFNKAKVSRFKKDQDTTQKADTNNSKDFAGAKVNDVNNDDNNADNVNSVSNSAKKKASEDTVVNPLEKFTNFLRSQYLRNIKQTVTYLSIALLAAIVVSVLFDYFVPFSSWGNVIRAFVVLADSVIFFSVGYLATFFIYMSQRASNPDYINFKDRFSPSWRNRISIVIGAVLFTMAITANQGLAYTIVSGIIVAGFVGIINFISRTEEEKDREFYGVPDKRDNAYRDALSDIQDKRKLKQDKKNKKD